MRTYINEEKQNSKTFLRQWAKTLRKTLDMETLSKHLVEKLRQTPEYQQAKTVMIFYPKEYEVNLLALLEDNSKTFYLPKIDGENLLCCPYGLGEDLCESCFKTKEPNVEPSTVCPELVVVPALAVDKNNYRLGYGGGFYDRFLAQNNCKKLVCIPSQFIVETIYPDEFDIPVDKVIIV